MVVRLLVLNGECVVAASFLFLQTSLCSQKNKISFFSPFRKIPSSIYMAALPYGIFSFFLLEMQVDMGSVARLEIPKDAAAYCFGKSLDQLTFLSKKNPKRGSPHSPPYAGCAQSGHFFPIFMLFSSWCMFKMQPCLPKKLSGAWRRSPRDGAACGNQNLDVLWAPQLWLISLRIMVGVD